MDPFYEVEQDCQQQFNVLEDFILRNSVSGKITNEVIQDYNNQRTEIIETIDDLRQSVESIQLNPELYPNIDHIELSNRALKISQLTESLNKLNLKWNENLNKNKDITTMSNRISQEFDKPQQQQQQQGDSNYQQFQQQELIREQDEHLENIHQTMQNLHLQATTMGSELEDQHVLLSQFDDEMDTVAGKLNGGLKRIEYFLEKNRDKASDCCILLLIVALVVLLFILIVV